MRHFAIQLEATEKNRLDDFLISVIKKSRCKATVLQRGMNPIIGILCPHKNDFDSFMAEVFTSNMKDYGLFNCREIKLEFAPKFGEMLYTTNAKNNPIPSIA